VIVIEIVVLRERDVSARAACPNCSFEGIGVALYALCEHCKVCVCVCVCVCRGEGELFNDGRMRKIW